MKNSKAFYRSALATAIVMALSAPAFAADNAVSTTPVTLDKDRQLWNKMLLLVVLHRLQPQQLMRKIKTLMLLWVVMILLLNQRQIKNSLKV